MTIDVDPDWWTRGWQARIVPARPSLRRALPDSLLPRPLLGALRAALMLIDSGVRDSAFRGLGLSRERIPIRTETCELCTNHCRLRIPSGRIRRSR